MKFTLSADSVPSFNSNYEDDEVKPSEVPEYIMKLASKSKFCLLIINLWQENQSFLGPF